MYVYAQVLSLLIPADTRFATEIICARSLQKDRLQIRQLFNHEGYDAWHLRQNPTMRQLSRKMKVLAFNDDFWHINEVI